MTTPKQTQPMIEELPLAELEKITGGRSAGWFPGMGVLGGLAGAAASPFDPGAGPSMDDAFAALGFGVQEPAPESPVAWHDVAEPPPSFIVGEAPGAALAADDDGDDAVHAAVEPGGGEPTPIDGGDAADADADVEAADADAGRDPDAVGIGVDDLAAADAEDDGIGALDGISLEDLALRDDDDDGDERDADDDAERAAADSGSFDALLATDDLAAIDDAELEVAYAAATAELLGEAPMFLAADDSTAPPLHLDEYAVASLDAPMFLDDLDLRDALAM